MDPGKDIRVLRRRMGWTPSDLARRLGVAATEIEIWEAGAKPKDPAMLSQLEFLLRQAEICCDEVKNTPLAEHMLDEGSLGQIDLDRVKDV